MTTNKPEIKIYEPSEKGVTAMRKASFRNTGPDRYVRLSDYEALQAECEKLRTILAQASEYVFEPDRDCKCQECVDATSLLCAITAAMQADNPC